MSATRALRGHVSMVTLGVADLERATRFYQALGFARSSASQPGISFMTSGTIVVGLFPTVELAKDAGTDVGAPGQGAIALAQNRHSEADVDQVMAKAEQAGARVVKPAQKYFGAAIRAILLIPTAICGKWRTIHSRNSTRTAT